MEKYLLLIIMIIALSTCKKNHDPMIVGITCSPEARSAGTLFTLEVEASDEDSDPLIYNWTADGGEFLDSTNSQVIRWRSPVEGKGQTFHLTVTVSDGLVEVEQTYPIELSDPVYGTVTGTVHFENCKIAIADALISIDDYTAYSDPDGQYLLYKIPVGIYTIRAEKEGFTLFTKEITVISTEFRNVDIPLVSISLTTKVSGIIVDQDGSPIEGALVVMLNPDNTDSQLAATTTAVGFYRIWRIPHGRRTFQVRKLATVEYAWDRVTKSVKLEDLEYQLDMEMKKTYLIGYVTDTRDNRTYRTQMIGSQTWMAENLAYLPGVSPNLSISVDEPRHYVYEYDGADTTEAKGTSNYRDYGVLYNWAAANKACPKGWHLPSDDEWTTLTYFIGMNGGYKLKSESGWVDHGGGDNSSGFGAVPGGKLDYRPSVAFTGLGTSAIFCSSTTASGANETIWLRQLMSGYDWVNRISSNKRNGYSVRCIKN